MFTYTTEEFKSVKPEAFQRLEEAVKFLHASNILLIASVEGEAANTFDVVVALQDRAAVLRLCNERQVSPEGRPTRFWLWTCRTLKQPKTAVMNEYAQAAFDKFINELDANAKTFYVAKAGQNSFGTSAYEVVTTSQTENGLLVNAFRVSARYGTQFRSGRWQVSLM